MVMAGYKQTEVGEIPKDWGVEKIGAFDPFVTSGSRGWAPYYSQYGSPFVRITNMVRGSIRLDLGDLRYVNLPSLSAEGKRTALQNDDILISITADIGICSLVNSELQSPAYINQHIALVRFNSKNIAPRFVAYYLNSRQVQKLFVRSSDQGAKTGMNLDTVRSIEFAVPQYDEQKAIADALSDADALIVSLEKLIEKKRHIKTATMQQLLTGKKRLPGFQKEWQIKKIEELADIDPENLSSTTNPLYEFRYVSLEDVDSGRLRGHSEQIFSTSPSRARRILRMNDVVIATVRPNLKSHFLFQRNEKDWICSTGFAVIRCNPGKADAHFLFYHFFSHQIELQIETLIAGSNYPAINSGDVRRLEINCPEIDEQAAIAFVISDMDKELHLLEEKLDKAKAIKQGMMQELLTGRTRLV